jgi:ATP-dependent Clp protease ATP-binding subunit ClpA
MLKEEVDEEDVAEVVAKWTGIPVSKMLEGEMQKLVTMEQRLSERVIGQEEALAAVANAVGAHVPDCKIRIAQLVRSFFLGRLVLAKQKLHGH